jgi:lysozyme family protein
MDLEQLITDTIEREGGWVDLPDDKGGPTNWGITLPQYRDWCRRQDATVDELRALTALAARDVYRSIFQQDLGLGGRAAASSPKLQELLLDCVVNHGIGGAVKFIQEALGVTVDGLMGPKTRAALAAAEPRELYRKVLAARIRKYGRIVTHDPTQSKFAAGWNDRAAQFVEEAP